MNKIRAMTWDEILCVAKQLSYSPPPNTKGVCIEDDTGAIGAAALYDKWTFSAVEVHIWTRFPKWLFHPQFVHEIFWYIFVQGKRLLAFAVTPCDNKPSLAISKAWGFKEICRIKDGWKSGTDMVIQELRREDCRFLEISEYEHLLPGHGTATH